jgi:hypothetical protein
MLMTQAEYIPIQHKDDYWTHDTPLFTGRFPYYRNEPRMVQGKIHLSKEQIYTRIVSEIVPLKSEKGVRNYVNLHPYVLEPQIVINIGMYPQPKQFADQESAIGQVLSSKVNGVRQREIGNAQAWYYPRDKVIVLWECFLHSSMRNKPLLEDENMQQLWKCFERWLIKKFPKAKTLATPFNDPIAESTEEYQAFLKSLGYSPIAQAAFGKKI